MATLYVRTDSKGWVNAHTNEMLYPTDVWPIDPLTPNNVRPSIPDTYNCLLSFSDEFGGTSVDTSKWALSYPWGDDPWGERQSYGSPNTTVSGGELDMKLSSGSVVSGKTFTGSILSTHASMPAFNSGIVEVRAKLPYGAVSNIEFQVWLQRIAEYNDDGPHISVVQNTGGGNFNKPIYAYLPGPSLPAVRKYGNFTAPNGSDVYHTYTMVWDSSNIKWYVDGVNIPTSTVTNISTEPMALILQLATSWYNAPAAGSLPAHAFIDYVRVWEFNA